MGYKKSKNNNRRKEKSKKTFLETQKKKPKKVKKVKSNILPNSFLKIIIALLAFMNQLKGVGFNASLKEGPDFVADPPDLNLGDYELESIKGLSSVPAIKPKKPSAKNLTLKKENDVSTKPTAETQKKSSTTSTPKYPNTLSYEKGDNASTVEEFADAVSGDYRVSYNGMAKDPEAFQKNPVIVYGEYHNEPVVPSVRGEKGVLILEHPGPEYCELDKFKELQDNGKFACEHIDSAKDTDILYAAYMDVYKKGATLIDLIEPGVYSYVVPYTNEGIQNAGNLVRQFINDNVDQDFVKKLNKDPKLLAHFRGAKTEFDDACKRKDAMFKDDSIVKRRREDYMKKRAVDIVKETCPPNENCSATIIVGDRHVEVVVNEFMKTLNRPVISARSIKAEQLKKFSSEDMFKAYEKKTNKKSRHKVRR